MKKNHYPWLAFISALFMPIAALAHSGHSAHGFLIGFNHPIGGLDHLMAMMAVGLWAAQMGGRSTWAVPLAFIVIMTLGGILGISGIALPFTELGILASVIFLGLLITFSMTLPLSSSVLLVAVFAIFHGQAHGAEMPSTISGLMYSMGFVLATALLHLAGIGTAYGLQKQFMEKLTPIAGAVITAGGVYLSFT